MRAQQVKYVIELARALAQQPGVHRVDLLTRRITDPSVAPSYGARVEDIGELAWGDPAAGGGAFVVRLEAGNPAVYCA